MDPQEQLKSIVKISKKQNQRIEHKQSGNLKKNYNNKFENSINSIKLNDMESESKNLEFTERDRKKKKKSDLVRERERETKQRTCEFGSRSMEGSRYTG